MFTASVRSSVPALVRALREARGVDAQLRAHATARHGRLVMHSQNTFDGRFRPLVTGQSLATKALYEKGNKIAQDIKTLRNVIRSQRESAPVDA